jgi:hypothetical protein
MTQPDVVLTDYGLALECLAFAGLLASTRHNSRFYADWFIVFFLSTAVAAVAGGTVHGFFEAPASFGSRVLWPLTLIAIGVTALSGARIGAALHFDSVTARGIGRAAAALFLFYCLAVLFITSNFRVAVVAYLPVVLFLGWVFWQARRRTNRPAFMTGFAGICVVLVAAGVQQAKIGIHPRYFNHNAIYHVLQAVGLFLIFATARDVSKQSEVQHQ